MEPVEIDSDGTYELYASANSTELYIIQSPFPKYEYFLIENRQPIGFDQQMWNGGIVLWHIDDTKLRMRERGYPGQPGTCVEGFIRLVCHFVFYSPAHPEHDRLAWQQQSLSTCQLAS